jgi:hypothetical protein
VILTRFSEAFPADIFIAVLPVIAFEPAAFIAEKFDLTLLLRGECF